MNSQFSRKATPESTTTLTAIEPKPSTNLASQKSRSATVVLKGRNRRRRHDGAAGGFGGVGAVGGVGGGGNKGGIGNESYQFVPVRRKPLSEYMVLEDPPAPSRPSAAPSKLPLDKPPMSYAAAVESLPVSRLKIKVVLSPRFKRASNQLPVKRQSPKHSQDNKFKTITPPQSKPTNAQVNPKWKVVQVAPQSRIAQVNPHPINSTLVASCKKSKANRSKQAKQKKREEAAIKELEVPEKPPNLLPSSPKFSEAFIYLNHHHEQMQRILAEQTAGQELHLNRGQVKPCKLNAHLPTHRSLFDLDERLFIRGDLEAIAIFAQNKAMLRNWLNPGLLIC
ncbi:uncharacterized protein LOC108042189 [Drosophila rhopaloa]|uniref:Uncharacterized protein LOC108042189 n=1 Tax=Drosophila rhopaloa TaxID=1041015 RepID=A0A6P4ERL4_DRORH|nr:uncharacterized protein LOC108042189 [Drosophila rhopaloa]